MGACVGVRPQAVQGAHENGCPSVCVPVSLCVVEGLCVSASKWLKVCRGWRPVPVHIDCIFLPQLPPTHPLSPPSPTPHKPQGPVRNVDVGHKTETLAEAAMRGELDEDEEGYGGENGSKVTNGKAAFEGEEAPQQFISEADTAGARI